MKTDHELPLTNEDVEFVINTLGNKDLDKNYLTHLVRDPEALDQLLDSPKINESLCDDAQCLRISAPLYFYLLTRNVLNRSGINSRPLSHYIAGVLSRFSTMRELEQHSPTGTNNFAYVSDLLIAMEKLPPGQAFHMRVYLGNYALFLTGIFADRIQSNSNRHGAPGIQFYEGIGQSSYHTAALDQRARAEDLQNLYESLSEHFHQVRMALNGMTDRMLHLHP